MLSVKNSAAARLKRATTLATLGVGLCLSAPSQAQLTAGEPVTNLQLTDWAVGLTAATDIAFLSDGRALVTLKPGQLMVVSPDGASAKMGVLVKVDSVSENGLLGVVVDSLDNIYLYASSGPDNFNKQVIYKARAAADGTVTVDLANPIVSMGLEGPANHDGGGMIIHKGQLYLGVGDTGSNATPPANRYGACLNIANGKILRVNLDGSIPADNPLNSLAMVTACDSPGAPYRMGTPDKRIYAWGLRNPWRLWIDAEVDLMWVGDVGETTEEEVSVGGSGTNFGYPFREGKTVHPPLGGIADCMGVVPPRPCTPPEDSYVHRTDPNATRIESSVTGGLVPPKRCGWGAFENRYLFGDYSRRQLWTLDLKPDRSGALPGSRKDLASNVSSPVSFRLGPDGAVYIVTNSEGSVKRLAPKALVPNCLAAQVPGDAGADGPVDGGGDGAGGAGGADAGTGGAAGDASGRGGRGGSGSDGAAAAPGSGDDGCSCNLGGHQAPAGAAMTLAGLALLIVTRKRRRMRR